MSWVFRDRAQAGEMLASRLAGYAHRDGVTVLALPRGGVPVAYPIAQALDAPLDILGVRKLGVPGHEELAMGAIAAGGIRVLNQDVVSRLAIDPATIDAAARVERHRLAEQQGRFRGNRPAAPREGRLVVLVDDGLATGSTMEAAIASCRLARVAGIIVAVPVGARETVAHLTTRADEIVCLAQPAVFRAVGLAYQDFAAVADEEVVALLNAAARPRW
ncbi:MAG: phosphoribosyltransferase [Actinomycetota bacterium]|nr:phosphoribosyltransferase [Actinomycetota bacterium]